MEVFSNIFEVQVAKYIHHKKNSSHNDGKPWDLVIIQNAKQKVNTHNSAIFKITYGVTLKQNTTILSTEHVQTKDIEEFFQVHKCAYYTDKIEYERN